MTKNRIHNMKKSIGLNKKLSHFTGRFKDRYELSIEYIRSGSIGKKYWDIRTEKQENNHAFVGSKERFDEILPEWKEQVKTLHEIDCKLKVFCLEEAEVWFNGFPDDSEINRRDFTASLYNELRQSIKRSNQWIETKLNKNKKK